MSQANWNRLEMKPKRHKGHGSGTLIASLEALLSKATSLEIFQSLKSLLTDLSQVSLGLPLPPLHYRHVLEPHYAPGPQEASVGHVQTISTKFLLNWCHPDPIPNNFVPDSISLCVPAKPPQHPHLCYTQLLHMSPSCNTLS